ncbi:Uncharacterised protein [Candidatus Ornithobacterium hominis]|uniref:hypothetical protein n=1 Tax=Candidatus Ornithobacterium hominis TaxID=2497989 RepID=UPI000E895CDA|nr:hypothetical protein [Candidatus Ornithobacterium hominis]SZD73365.1 Uncharacterised protein [Candidatus Ornithobacterium hominis]
MNKNNEKSKDEIVKPENRETNQSKKESAINKTATEGEKINPKETAKREHNLPRDTA